MRGIILSAKLMLLPMCDLLKGLMITIIIVIALSTVDLLVTEGVTGVIRSNLTERGANQTWSFNAEFISEDLDQNKVRHVEIVQGKWQERARRQPIGERNFEDFGEGDDILHGILERGLREEDANVQDLAPSSQSDLESDYTSFIESPQPSPDLVPFPQDVLVEEAYLPAHQVPEFVGESSQALKLWKEKVPPKVKMQAATAMLPPTIPKPLHGVKSGGVVKKVPAVVRKGQIQQLPKVSAALQEAGTSRAGTSQEGTSQAGTSQATQSAVSHPYAFIGNKDTRYVFTKMMEVYPILPRENGKMPFILYAAKWRYAAIFRVVLDIVENPLDNWKAAQRIARTMYCKPYRKTSKFRKEIFPDEIVANHIRPAVDALRGYGDVPVKHVTIVASYIQEIVNTPLPADPTLAIQRQNAVKQFRKLLPAEVYGQKKEPDYDAHPAPPNPCGSNQKRSLAGCKSKIEISFKENKKKRKILDTLEGLGFQMNKNGVGLRKIMKGFKSTKEKDTDAKKKWNVKNVLKKLGSKDIGRNVQRFLKSLKPKGNAKSSASSRDQNNAQSNRKPKKRPKGNNG